MATLTLSVYEDHLPEGVPPVFLPRAARAIYVLTGGIMIEDVDREQHVVTDGAWTSGGELGLRATADTRIWRWELTRGPAAGAPRSAPFVTSTLKFATEVELDDGFSWMMRCDQVSFPPGGTAWTHLHQGPGVRVCLEGEITIETEGTRRTYGPGEAWVEKGTEPVLAPTTQEQATRFIRCFLLPRALGNRSSLRYALADDADKPKEQAYHVFSQRSLADAEWRD